MLKILSSQGIIQLEAICASAISVKTDISAVIIIIIAVFYWQAHYCRRHRLEERMTSRGGATSPAFGDKSALTDLRRVEEAEQEDAARRADADDEVSDEEDEVAEAALAEEPRDEVHPSDTGPAGTTQPRPLCERHSHVVQTLTSSHIYL